MEPHLPDLRHEAVEHLREVIAEVKPRLRGWLHLGIVPLTLAAGVVLVALAPTETTRIGAAVFTGTALVLFTVSAAYHRGTWSPRVRVFLRRFDHANIFLLIAGTYTPYCLLLLEGTERIVLLCIAWAGATLGVGFRIFWVGAPRWLHTPIYLALGWAAVFFTPGFITGADRLPGGSGTAALLMLAVGGGLYTIGAVIYGVQKPDPWPRWFGFHEVFHSFTVLAFASHYVGVSLATYSLR